MSTTTSSPFVKTVALAGVGNLGSFILSSLLSSGLSVTVLTRPSSNKSFPPGVNVKEVDYDDEAQLIDAVKGVDVVVSTLTALGAQSSLIRAAKKAEVKLFVPGEFGNPSTDLTPEAHPALYGKKQAQDLLAEVGLPALLVFTGPFLDTVFNPYLGFDFPSRKIRLIGTGNTPISLTARPDIARFLSHYLSTLTPSALPSPGEPTILRLEGDRKTFREGVALYASVNSLDPSSFEYSTVSLDEADKIAKDVQADFGRSLVSWLLASWERGARVDQGKGEGVLSGNDWEEWRPVKLEEHFRKQKEEKEKA